MGSMNTYLVRSAAAEFRLDEHALPELLLDAEQCQGRLAFLIDGDDSLAAAQLVFPQWRIDAHTVLRPVPLDECQVALANPVLALQGMQRAQRGTPFRDHQQAGCCTVEPVHQFKAFLLGPEQAQLLDDPETDAAATMHGEPRWLVDHEQLFILENDGVVEKLLLLVGELSGRSNLCCPDGRDSYLVTDGEAEMLLDALAVDTYLAASEQAVDMAPGNAFQVPQEEVVDALRIGLVTDAQQSNLVLGLPAHAGKWQEPRSVRGSLFPGIAGSILAGRLLCFDLLEFGFRFLCG